MMVCSGVGERRLRGDGSAIVLLVDYDIKVVMLYSILLKHAYTRAGFANYQRKDSNSSISAKFLA